ncbi:serine/threonine protein kinase [Candidatus Woesearchaeota archaeon]|nr:serine/threonine protein kinase [Candidatus Woesearchaeota archaeon]
MSELLAKQPKENVPRPFDVATPVKKVSRQDVRNKALREHVTLENLDTSAMHPDLQAHVAQLRQAKLDEKIKPRAEAETSESLVDAVPTELSDVVDASTHYTIVGELGNGRQGSVLKIQYNDERVVARKYVKDTKEGRLALDRETLAKQINHPNVVRILDVGEDERGLYVEREYVEGHSLREHLNTHKDGLPIKEFLLYGKQLVDAVAEIHRNKLVHGDLKPENILIDKNGIVKVADFGIARPAKTPEELKRSLTTIIERQGSLMYMAPEQWRHGIINEKSDAYSLTKILLEMATGEAPDYADAVREQTFGGGSVARRVLRFLAERSLHENPANRFGIEDISDSLAKIESARVEAEVNKLETQTRNEQLSWEYYVPFAHVIRQAIRGEFALIEGYYDLVTCGSFIVAMTEAAATHNLLVAMGAVVSGVLIPSLTIACKIERAEESLRQRLRERVKSSQEADVKSEQVLVPAEPRAVVSPHQTTYKDVEIGEQCITPMSILGTPRSPAVAFDEGLRLLRANGFDRYMRANEMNTFRMADLSGKLEYHLRKTIQTMQFYTPKQNARDDGYCEWLSLAFQKKDNTLLAHIDPDGPLKGGVFVPDKFECAETLVFPKVYDGIARNRGDVQSQVIFDHSHYNSSQQVYKSEVWYHDDDFTEFFQSILGVTKDFPGENCSFSVPYRNKVIYPIAVSSWGAFEMVSQALARGVKEKK